MLPARRGVTCGQFSEDSLTFFTEPGWSLLMSLEWGGGQLAVGPRRQRLGPHSPQAGSVGPGTIGVGRCPGRVGWAVGEAGPRGARPGATHSQRMMPSFRPSWKLVPMLMPVTSSIQPRRSSSACGSYLDAIWNTGPGEHPRPPPHTRSAAGLRGDHGGTPVTRSHRARWLTQRPPWRFRTNKPALGERGDGAAWGGAGTEEGETRSTPRRPARDTQGEAARRALRHGTETP